MKLGDQSHRTLMETLLIIGLVCIGPALKFRDIFNHKAGAIYGAASKFPFTMLHAIHRSWMPWDAMRAAIFYLSLAVVGLAAPWRGGLRSRWVLALILGCWGTSFLFMPGTHEIADTAGVLQHNFYINVSLSLLWTLIFTTAWVRAQRKLPIPIAAAMTIPLFMTVHTLTSFFYVFSLR